MSASAALVVGGRAVEVRDKAALFCQLLVAFQTRINAMPFGTVRLTFGAEGVDLYVEEKLAKKVRDVERENLTQT